MNCILMGLVVICSAVTDSSAESVPPRDNGSIVFWTIAGPLPNENTGVHGKGCRGFHEDYLQSSGGEGQAAPSEGDRIPLAGGRKVTWTTAATNSSGILDFAEAFHMSGDASGVAYAYCRLISSEKQNVSLKIRSNDGVRVWLNQTMIHDHHLGRTLDAAEDTVPATLTKGENRLLVKVDQSGGGWGFSLRVLGSDGRRAGGVRSAISVPGGLRDRIVSATIVESPLVLNTAKGPRQRIVAHITSGGAKNVTCSVSKTEWSKPHVIQLGDLSPGTIRLDIEIPVVTVPGPARVVLRSATGKLKLPELQLSPPREWTVYLVQHVHTDIGYTRPQTDILPEHLRYIDYALDYCDQTDGYPDDARFRWTCEVSWAVREYCKRRPRAQIERLKRRVAEGRIEIAGMFLNMSEIANESSMAASLQPIRTIEDQLGTKIRVAMQDDVNGLAWCLADYFHDIGLKYVNMGINRTRSILPFDKPTPFWWESPSGKRVLAFRADHYHTANFWKIHDADLAAFERGLFTYLKSLAKRGYAYDQVSIQYSGYHTDNSPPATKPCELIRAWNEKYAWPKLRSAVTSEYLQQIEKKHGKDLPVHRQAWPDWWTDGFGSAARETAAARRTHVDMQVNETLLAMAALFGAPPASDAMKRATAVHENLLFYDEHTFGAAESISDPMAANSMVQWGEKASYVWEAVKQAGLLREEALGALQGVVPRADVPTIVVFNTLNWKRSGQVDVFIDHEILPRDKSSHIVDATTKQPVLAQPLRSRREGTHWALWAADVPPMGYKSYRIEPGEPPPGIAAESGTPPERLENAFYRVQLDPKTGGVVSLVDKELSAELVDTEAKWQCGQLFYETLVGGRDFTRDGFRRVGLRNVKLQPGSNGPIWKSIQILAEMDGCDEPNGVRAELRLYDTEKRVEFHYAIRKSPLRHPEAVYVAFPFAWPDGEIVYEAQGGMVRPGRDQIPGSASDWQTVQNFLTVRSGRGQIVWSSDQAPLVQLGDLNLGKWQPVTEIDKPHVYSWVLNNYWFTNFRATQEGELEWSYSLTSVKDPANTPAARFGWGSRVPLVPRVLPPGESQSSAAVRSALDAGAPNIVLVSARPAHYGEGVILHLRELDGKPTTLHLTMPSSTKRPSFREVNVLEKPLKSAGSALTFAPYETKFVELVLDSASSP